MLSRIRLLRHRQALPRTRHPLMRPHSNPVWVPRRMMMERGRRTSPDHRAVMKWSESSPGPRTRTMRVIAQARPSPRSLQGSPWPRLHGKSLPHLHQALPKAKRWQSRRARRARRHLPLRCCQVLTMRHSWRRCRSWLLLPHPWRCRAILARTLSFRDCHHQRLRRSLALGHRLWPRRRKGLKSPHRRCLV